MIVCDTEEERQLLKALIWACYDVVVANKPERMKAIQRLDRALEDAADLKL